jgi:RecB family exonuclease
MPWPAAPLPPAVEERVERGREFHRLMQRHFLELFPQSIPSQLAGFWDAWQRHPVRLPPGRRMPEITLTVPLGDQRLLARLDLLVLADDGRALILDWKTETSPRTRAQLQADVQTRLYPFVLAEGSSALALPGGAADPERIEMFYWQANDPSNPVRFAYSNQAHAASHKVLRALADQASSLVAAAEPPMVDDETVCASCAYRTYCGRQVPPAPVTDWETDLEPAVELEPSR